LAEKIKGGEKMKTAIVYQSYHHGNTKKLLDAIAEKYEVTLIDAEKQRDYDLSQYDRIGFASGIAVGKFYSKVLKAMKEKLPEGKEVFFIFTCGVMKDRYTNAAKKIARKKNAKILGEYGCLGYDTVGIFKLFGGFAKGHPTREEIEKAVEFYGSLK